MTRFRFRRRLSSVSRAALSPLTLSALTASAAGAMLTVIMAHQLPTNDFARFSLAYLVGFTVAGLARGGVFQPALLWFRTVKRPILGPRQAISVTAIAAVLTGGLIWLIARVSVQDALILGVLSSFPVLQDWLRHRALAAERWKIIAASDIARFGVAPLALILPISTAAVAIGWVFLCSLPATLILILSYRRAEQYATFKDYWRQAIAQGADYLVASLNGTVPTLILGSVALFPLLGALRVAQTLVGPLNLIFVAVEMNLVGKGATTRSLSSDKALVNYGSLLARRILAGSTVVIILGGAVALALPEALLRIPGVLLLGAILLVGSSQVTSGWVGIHIVVLRLLGRAGAVARSRLYLIGIVWAAHALGYALGGPQTSLVLGLATSALVYPAIFALLSRRLYHR